MTGGRIQRSAQMDRALADPITTTTDEMHVSEWHAQHAAIRIIEPIRDWMWRQHRRGSNSVSTRVRYGGGSIITRMPPALNAWRNWRIAEEQFYGSFDRDTPSHMPAMGDLRFGMLLPAGRLIP